MPKISNNNSLRCGEKLRVGVVGGGHFGGIHAQIYAQMADVDLVDVADGDERRASDLAELFGCTAYRDARDLLGKVDAVSIVVPTKHHWQVASVFLQEGMRTLVASSDTHLMRQPG